MDFKDYYAILGVPRDADEQAIRRAYRKKAREFHPDVNKGNLAAEERFKEVNEAYEVLKDAEKRSRYDRFGADWERYRQAEQAGAAGADFSDWFFGGQRGPEMRYEYRTSSGQAGTGFSDFFETLFGDSFGRTGTRRRARPQPRRGQDYEYPLEISLRDAFSGTTRRFDVQVQENCPTCGGSGLQGGGLCPTCGGNGVLNRTRTLEVKIPAGVRTGSKVRVAGQGAPGVNGGPNGDIYLNITIAPNPNFELDGDHLRTEVSVPLYTAILGGDVRVSTLNGTLELRIPEGTQNGQVFRLRGKGMPSLKGGQRGDLLARVKVQLPTRLSDEERHLFERLRSEAAKV